MEGMRARTLLLTTCLLVPLLPLTQADAPPLEPWIVRVADATVASTGATFAGRPVLDAIPELGALVVLGDASLARDPRVLHAERDLRAVEALARAPPLSGLSSPNDPHYSADGGWGVRTVRAAHAWGLTSGSADAAVCVVDTGARLTHLDFAGPRYLGGVDLVHDDADPADDHGHGTSVLGVAAADIDDGSGIAGVANTGFYVVKALGADGLGTLSDVAEGIVWCAEHTPSRTVISLSFGTPLDSQLLADAVHHAFAVRGKPVVAAAGNDACDGCVRSPARLPESIAVGCTRRAETACALSSRGPEVDVAAPGDALATTCATSDDAICERSGTSLAAPLVAGLLALTWSGHPDLTAVQLWARLNATTVDLGVPGRDDSFGHGRVDARCLLDGTSCAPQSDDGLEPLWTETFGEGALRWSVEGLWHATACAPLGGSTVLAYRASGCGSYDTGGATAGTARSAPLELPADASTLRLVLRSWHATERGDTHDRKTVSALRADGTRVALGLETGLQGAWNERAYDLAPLAGETIRLELAFDSVDALDNAHAGWAVDDLALLSDVPGVGDPALPRAPRDLRVARGPDVGMLDLSWAPPSAWGEGAPSHYRVLRATPEGAFEHLTDTTATSLLDAGLGVGATWRYRVVAVSTLGAGPPSVAASGTTHDVPSAPRALAGAPVAPAFSLQLAWEAPEDDGGLAVERYHVERASAAEGPYATLGATDARAWTDGGLAEDAEHWYRVRAENAAGVGAWSAPLALRTPTTPGAPREVTSVPGGGVGEVIVAWGSPESDGGAPILRYHVERDSGDGFQRIGSALGSPFVDADADLLHVHRYRVVAENLVREGPASDPACARASPWPRALSQLCATRELRP